jgi:hypothetical protein
MTIEELEFALWRIDVMLGLLKRSVERGANAQAAADLHRLQRWRDDLDTEINLERIRRAPTSLRSAHRCIRERCQCAYLPRGTFNARQCQLAPTARRT